MSDTLLTLLNVNALWLMLSGLAIVVAFNVGTTVGWGQAVRESKDCEALREQVKEHSPSLFERANNPSEN